MAERLARGPTQATTTKGGLNALWRDVVGLVLQDTSGVAFSGFFTFTPSVVTAYQVVRAVASVKGVAKFREALDALGYECIGSESNAHTAQRTNGS